MSSAPTTANRDWAAHGGTFALLWLLCWTFEAAFVTNRLGFPIGLAVAAVTAIVVAGYAWGLVWIMAWLADRRDSGTRIRAAQLDAERPGKPRGSRPLNRTEGRGIFQLDAGSAPRFIRPAAAPGELAAWSYQAPA